MRSNEVLTNEMRVFPFILVSYIRQYMIGLPQAFHSLCVSINFILLN